jgi:hypothetical protein
VRFVGTVTAEDVRPACHGDVEATAGHGALLFSYRLCARLPQRMVLYQSLAPEAPNADAHRNERWKLSGHNHRSSTIGGLLNAHDHRFDCSQGPAGTWVAVQQAASTIFS